VLDAGIYTSSPYWGANVNRRNFVSASLGSLGALGASWAHGQAPSCPPPLIDAGGEPVSTGCGAGQLAQVAAGLSAGQSVNFSSGPAWRFSDSVTWQTATVYHDSARGQVHAVGKVASNNPYEHYVYDEGTSRWGANTLSLTTFGHMWNTAFSPEHGEYYFVASGTEDIQRYVPGQGWRTTPESGFSGGSGHAGMGWHPDLFGPNDGGVVVNAQSALVAWRRSTNAWTALETGLSDPGYNGGSGAYNRATGKLWLGTGNGGRARVIASGSGGRAGAVSSVGLPPLMVYGGGEGDSTNKVIPHPYTPGKLLLIASNTSAVYQSTNDGTSWSSAGYTHPFVIGGGQWTCGPIAAYGVVWGLSSGGRGSMSRIWKPPA
jgi:hypothetical protein